MEVVMIDMKKVQPIQGFGIRYAGMKKHNFMQPTLIQLEQGFADNDAFNSQNLASISPILEWMGYT